MNSIVTIAFYNLENLFDTKDDPHTLDRDFLPWGKKFWTKKKYHKKVLKMGKAISKISSDKTGKAPVLVGLAEVENATVVADLVNSKYLKAANYSFVHYDSPDERGIDVALLVNNDDFTVEHSETIPISVYELDGVKDYTRDALYVQGNLNGEEVHVFVCHWPSRRNGADETSHKRIQAAKQITEYIRTNGGITERSKIIIMGDFNDNPVDDSVKNYLVTDLLYNPFEKLLNITRGSLSHYSQWHLFDQIIFSHNFFKSEKGKYSFQDADIFDHMFLKEWQGRNEGTPFRTYSGKQYLGGYSDHFPVYINLKKS
ncbi:MAG: endonuclease [Flavobacteriaceae bacterium]